MGLLDRMFAPMVERQIEKRMSEWNQSIPAYMRAEVDPLNDQFNYTTMTEAEIQRVALATSWIYADIDLLSKKVISSPLLVKRQVKDKKEDVVGHEFERLLRKPNEFMSRSYLLRYIIFWLSISRKGAFLYMAPQRGTNDKIVELWPVNSNRIEPVENKANYVKWYIYTPSNKTKKRVKINAKYIIWFKHPNIHNYWESYPPLWAALDPMAIEKGINEAQKTFYTKSRGVPMSIISASPDINSADFAQFRQDLKDDWENDGSTLAIARGGTLDVKSLGFTQKDLEILGNQELTRDKIDSVLLGIPFRSDAFQSGEGIKQAEKFINNNAVHPLHVLLAEDLTLQGLLRFWGDDLIAEFKDIRSTDRAISIQEKNTAMNYSTIDEMRKADGLPPLSDSEVGELLVPLGTNPGFIAELKGMSIDKSKIGTLDDPTGNLPDAESSLATTNRLAAEASKAELKRWKVVARRSFKQHNNALHRTFTSDIIPSDVVMSIQEQLKEAKNIDDITEIFGRYFD